MRQRRQTDRRRKEKEGERSIEGRLERIEAAERWRESGGTQGHKTRIVKR
jgi:hypothetical protein